MQGKPTPINTWPKLAIWAKRDSQCSPQASIKWILLKPYKGLIICNTIGQYHGLQQTMCANHVKDLKHLWLNPESMLTLTIPLLNLTWSNHQLPSNIYEGILHTLPYHLGLSLDFTDELPEVCMPCKQLHYLFFFMCFHSDYTITIHCIILSLSMLVPCLYFAMLPLYLHENSVIDVHIKKSPSTGLHGSSTAVTSNSIGILFTYMAHQSCSKNRD